jgi:hypothetical protein
LCISPLGQDTTREHVELPNIETHKYRVPLKKKRHGKTFTSFLIMKKNKYKIPLAF